MRFHPALFNQNWGGAAAIPGFPASDPFFMVDASNLSGWSAANTTYDNVLTGITDLSPNAAAISNFGAIYTGLGFNGKHTFELRGGAVPYIAIGGGNGVNEPDSVTALSVHVVARFGRAGGGQLWATGQTGASSRQIDFKVTDSQIQFFFNAAGGTSSTTFTANHGMTEDEMGMFHVYSFRIDATTWALYLDGVKIGSGVWIIPTSWGNNRMSFFGFNTWTAGATPVGNGAEVRVYEDLPEEECQGLDLALVAKWACNTVPHQVDRHVGTPFLRSSASTATFDVAYPTTGTIEDGDLLVIWTGAADSAYGGDDLASSLGWTTYHSSVRGKISWKWADGTETGSLTITPSASTYVDAVMFHFKNVHPTEPMSRSIWSSDNSTRLAAVDVWSVGAYALAIGDNFAGITIQTVDANQEELTNVTVGSLRQKVHGAITNNRSLIGSNSTSSFDHPWRHFSINADPSSVAAEPDLGTKLSATTYGVSIAERTDLTFPRAFGSGPMHTFSRMWINPNPNGSMDTFIAALAGAWPHDTQARFSTTYNTGQGTTIMNTVDTALTRVVVRGKLIDSTGTEYPGDPLLPDNYVELQIAHSGVYANGASLRQLTWSGYIVGLGDQWLNVSGSAGTVTMTGSRAAEDDSWAAGLTAVNGNTGDLGIYPTPFEGQPWYQG